MRILFCGDIFPDAPDILQAKLPHDEMIVCPRAAVRESLAGVDVVIPLMTPIDAAIMEAGRFRLIHQFGVGLEGVDLAAARARGIRVANVPSADSGNADSVAEHALMLTLAVLRQLPLAQASVRAGRLGTPLGHTLSGRTVCLFGLGAIARALARRLQPFDVRVIGISREPAAARSAALGLEACYGLADRHEALARTDVLVLCLPLTGDTRAIIDAEALAALPAGACLVNIARGPLVDYAALRAALEHGHLLGAGLDVFWHEPIAPDDPLLALPNVIATPHVAGVTDQSYDGIARTIAENVERLRRGEPLLNCAA
ncbi:MAG: 2-hydroxyacid dehydrogenase [Acidobacteriota bacterium]|nr:2-hydroxyacid dehydrogenase [Acidobacteriota bacterium]